MRAFTFNKGSLWFFFLCLAGCGFHLRGNVDLPPWLNEVAIVSQGGSQDLDPLLRDQLQSYHINVPAEPALAKYWLIIQNESFQQQITSVSSSTTPRQYQLLYTVGFKLQKAHGRDVTPASVVTVTRQITINSDRILGSNQEESITKNEMRRDAIIQILYRLRDLTKSSIS